MATSSLAFLGHYTGNIRVVLENTPATETGAIHMTFEKKDRLNFQ